MKTKVLIVTVLSAIVALSAKAQLAITTNTLAPVLTAYDQYYLPGPVDEATNAMTTTGSDNTTSADNDILTYVAADKASKGQSFTTGPNPAGYTISSVTVRHILWTNFLGNGTWMNIPSGASFAFRFGTIAGANITSMLDTNGTYSGSALSMSGGSGTGISFTFDLTGAGLPTLSPNTTYFFEIASGSQYFELHNTRTNATSYTGGTAFYGDTTAQLTQSGVVNLPPYGGEFAFVAKLAPVGAPSLTADANPNSGTSGQTFTVTANVVPGAGTVTNVSVDLSAIGGVVNASLVLSNANVYTNTFTVPAGAPIGTANLTVTATDTTPLSASAGVTFTVLPSSFVWSGSSSTDSKWSTTANWLGGFAPALSGNNVIFAGTTRLTPDMDNSYGVTSLVFSNTAGAFTIASSVNGVLTVGGGGIDNESANAQTLNMPVVMGTAQTFNAAAGNLILNSNLTGSANLTVAGSGSVTLASAGTNSIRNLRLSSGQFNIAAGTVNATDDAGSSTRVESNAVLTVSGGTLNIVDGGNGWFPIGVTSGSTGTVVVAGGTINVLDHWGTEVGNETGAGELMINSGTFLNNDIGNVGLLIGENGSMGGTVDLNGGALVVNKIIANAGGNFFFNGGTLRPIASSGSFWNYAGNLTTSIRDNGAIVDTAGFNVTIAQPLLHSTIGTDNATDGGLTKIGNGTLTLTSGYNYTGPNKVLGGTEIRTLLSGGLPASGGDLVVSNATLLLDASASVTMPVANVTLNSGAVATFTNVPGVNAISGTGNVLVDTNTTLNLNYGAVGGSNPTAAAIVVSGTMSVNGTNNVINLAGSGFVAGEFPLIKYGSGSLASISGFKLGSLPPGVNAVLTNDTVNQQLGLNITFIGQTLTWYGTNALWDINTTFNWNSAGAKYLEYGVSPSVYGDLVTFDDTLYNDFTNPQATNVNVTAVLHPSQMAVNSSLPYTFAGTGSISGNGALYQNGSGSLALLTSNSYTGGTFVNAGTIIVTNDNALGTNTALLTLNGGSVQFAGSTVSTRPISMTAAATISVLPAVTAQLSGNVTGGGNLTKIDNGTLALSPGNTNSFGDLRLSGGQLNIAGGVVIVRDTQGSSTRIENNTTLTISGGTLNIQGSNVLNGWFPIGVTASATGTVVVAGGTIDVNDHWGTEVGNESGTGVLTINSGAYINHDAGGVGLLIADGSSPQGTINLNGGMLIVNKIAAGSGVGGQFYFNGGTLKPYANNSGFWPNSTKITAAVRNGGAVIDTAGFNATIAQVLSHSTVVGDSATDGGLTKVGNGTLVLSGANAYNGNTAVNGGTLELAQSAATLATNSTVSIASGAQLKLDVATVTNIVKYLVFNGTTNSAGLYSGVNGGGYISGVGYVLVLNGVGPSGPATITNSFSGGVLSLAWPSGQGWRLQGQTNSLSTGLGTNWTYLTDGSVSSTNITVNPSAPAVFYRLVYP